MQKTKTDIDMKNRKKRKNRKTRTILYQCVFHPIYNYRYIIYCILILL